MLLLEIGQVRFVLLVRIGYDRVVIWNLAQWYTVTSAKP